LCGDWHDASTRQVILAWLLAHSPALVPLPGTPDPDSHGEDLDSMTLELTADEIGLLS
jgi:pyridoxine 4-dehydrogenase